MKARIVVLLMVLVAGASAQQQGGTSESGTTAKPEQAPPPAAGQKKSAADATASQEFSSAVADALLARMAQGLARRNPKYFLAAFDAAKYPDYPVFAERITALLNQHDSFRTYYHVIEASEQDGRGAAQVDITTERTARNSGSVPVRQNARARFEFERSSKGWRIVAMDPPDLLTQ